MGVKTTFSKNWNVPTSTTYNYIVSDLIAYA